MNIVISFIGGLITATVDSVDAGKSFSILIKNPFGQTVGTIGVFDASNLSYSIAIPTQNGVELEGNYSFEMTNVTNLDEAETLDKTLYNYCPFDEVSVSLVSDCSVAELTFDDGSSYPDGATVVRSSDLTATLPSGNYELLGFSDSNRVVTMTYGGVTYELTTDISVSETTEAIDTVELGLDFTYTREYQKQISKLIDCYNDLCLLKTCIDKFYSEVKTDIEQRGGFDYLTNIKKDKFAKVTGAILQHQIGKECRSDSIKEFAYNTLKEILDCDCCDCNEPFELNATPDSVENVLSGNSYIGRSVTDNVITLTFDDTQLPVQGLTAGTNVTITEVNGVFTINSTGGSGGQVDSIQVGSNITIDNTDPTSPIIDTHDISTVNATNNNFSTSEIYLSYGGGSNQVLQAILNYSVSVVHSPLSGNGYLTVTNTGTSLNRQYNVLLKDNTVQAWTATSVVDNQQLTAGTYRKIGQVVQFSNRVQATASGITPVNRDYASRFPADYRPDITRRYQLIAYDGSGNYLGVAGAVLITTTGTVQTRFGGDFDFASAPINQNYYFDGDFIAPE